MHDSRQEVASFAERSTALAPAYARAVREENLQDLIMIRRQIAVTLDQADKLIVDCLVSNLERRLAEDIEERLTQQ